MLFYASFVHIVYVKLGLVSTGDFPIDAKNHKVLLIWDLNGYGEYEFDWCICDKDMACTSVGVRLGQWRRNQKHNTPEISGI